MATKSEDLKDLMLKVGEIQGSVDLLTKISGKLDDTIENLREVSSNLVKVMAVHEERFRHHDDADDRLANAFDEHGKDDARRFDEMNKTMEKNQGIVLKKIDGIKEDFQSFRKYGFMVLGAGFLLIWIMSSASSGKLSGIIEAITNLF